MDDIQLQLQEAKRDAAQAFNPDRGAEPKWLSTMPNVYGISLPLTRLLDQLPAVKATHLPSVIATYFNELVAEITKLYAFRVEIVELSDTIPEPDKAAEVQNLLTEAQDMLAQLGAWLEYTPPDD